ncbi:MAG: TerB family tellurite resistance protein [Deltaproteobacteria bacterium]|nr:TerB family tellurite resistance protein [Deltaproteobacteria bacterium]
MAADEAIASWLGALTDGGVLSASAYAGRAVAVYVLGEETLRRLRSAFDKLTPEQAEDEKVAAIETCLWMAAADRFVAPEERMLLVEMIACAGLSPETKAALEGEIGDQPSLADLELRLGTYELRELLLAMCWELAVADGRIDRMETGFYRGLAARLGVTPERSESIRAAVQAELGGERNVQGA